MTLVEVPIKSSAEVSKGMVLVYKRAPEKRWLIQSQHRPYYTIEYKGQKVPVGNHRKNKIMMSNFDDPQSIPFLGCFVFDPNDDSGYRMFRQQP